MPTRPEDAADRRSPLSISRRSTLLGAAATPFCAGFTGSARAVVFETMLASGRDQTFDRDWRFRRGDDERWSRADLDDGDWRMLELPHDWSIEDLEPGAGASNRAILEVDTAPLWGKAKPPPKVAGPFDGGTALIGGVSRSAGGRYTGHTVGGVGWYRKRFRLDADASRHVELVFDGVYMNAEIWLNGVRLERHASGYAPFVVELPAELRRVGENVIAVRVANLGKNSRWYSGSGIYRHVRLNVTGRTRLATWGVRLSTTTDGTAATVSVAARTEGLRSGCRIRAVVFDAQGRRVATGALEASETTMLQLRVSDARLWSPESPALYRIVCELLDGEAGLDSIQTSFGVRTITVDAAAGLRINGRPYKLRGGCIHHDNGVLGAVAIGRAEERKIELLKGRGFNAVRISHNPASPALLEACDRLGMLVVEEAFDGWRVPKNPDDFTLYFDGEWRRDLDAMVGRDGNHPSVVMWSIGNEIPETSQPQGAEIARMLTAEMRRLDPSRPLTQAIFGSNGPAVTTADGRADQLGTQYLDVVGYNYNFNSYESDHRRFPARVLLGTESFPQFAAKIWRITEANPYVIGDFVWAAMDYLGEAGLGNSSLGNADPNKGDYPQIGAYCGDVDLIGGQKPQSLLRDVLWGLSAVEMAVQRPLPEGAKESITPWGWRDELQSWTWAGAEGKPLSVAVHTLGDRVELILNGRRIAERGVDPQAGPTVLIDVPYDAGTLVARAYRGGNRIGERRLVTAGAPAALRLVVDRSAIRHSRDDLAFATVEVVDASGRLVPDAVHVVTAEVVGAVDLAGAGNANPRGVASYQQPVFKTWHGRGLMVLRPSGAPGRAVVKVESDGLAPAMARLTLA